MPDSDFELLDQYARGGSQEAFARLVERYSDLVYSSARRRVGNADLAEEITQAVFIVLAKKAGSLNPRTILAGWLIKTTGYAAAHALTERNRRQKHERVAAQMRSEISTSVSSENRDQIFSRLDEALGKLSSKDSDAIVLRYLQQKSLPEVAQEIGISEAAAQRRVLRALGKLRGILARQGVVLPAAGIGAALALVPVFHTPPAFAGNLVGLTAVGQNGAGFSLAQSVLRMMKWLKIKLALTLTSGSIIVIAMGLVSVHAILAELNSVQAATNPTTQPVISDAVTKSLVDQYAQSLALSDRISYTAQITYLSISTDGKSRMDAAAADAQPDAQKRPVMTMLYRRDGDQRDMAVLNQGVEPTVKNLADPESYLRRNLVWHGNQTTYFYAAGLRSRRAVYAQSWPKLTANQLARQNASLNMAFGTVVDGEILGGTATDLAETLRNARDLHRNPDSQIIDGQKTSLLEGSDDRQTYKIWLDPAVGAFPRRVEIHRLDQGGPGLDATVESIQFEKVGQIEFPVSAHITADLHTEDHHRMQFDSLMHRSNIDFNPDFQAVGAFKMLAPADYAVINSDFANSQWALKDGELVPKNPNDPAATRPTSVPSDAAQKIMSQVEAESKKLAALLPSPQILGEQQFRDEHGAELIAMLRRQASLLAQLQATLGKHPDPDFDQHRNFNLGLLAALGDQRATDELAARTDPGAKANLALGQWLLSSNDASAQAKLLEDFKATAQANPSDNDVAIILYEMSQCAANDDLSDKALDVIRKTMTGPMAERLAARDDADSAQKKMLGKPLNITGTSTTGQSVSTADMKGKVILLQFWATWCSGCEEEIPVLKNLYTTYHEKGLEIVGIDADNADETVNARIDEKGMPWPQLRQDTSQSDRISDPLNAQWHVREIPAIFLIDKAGNLRFVDGTVGAEEKIKGLLSAGGK